MEIVSGVAIPASTGVSYTPIEMDMVSYVAYSASEEVSDTYHTYDDRQLSYAIEDEAYIELARVVLSQSHMRNRLDDLQYQPDYVNSLRILGRYVQEEMDTWELQNPEDLGPWDFIAIIEELFGSEVPSWHWSTEMLDPRDVTFFERVYTARDFHRNSQLYRVSCERFYLYTRIPLPDDVLTYIGTFLGHHIPDVSENLASLVRYEIGDELFTLPPLSPIVRPEVRVNFSRVLEELMQSDLTVLTLCPRPLDEFRAECRELARRFEARGPVRTQSSDEMLNDIKNVADKLTPVAHMEIPWQIWDWVEGGICLILSLWNCDSVLTATACVAGYARSILKKSLVKTAVDELARLEDYISTLSYKEQSFAEEPDWLQLLKKAKTDWKLVMDNRHSKNLKHLISICVALGLCQSSSVDFSVKGVKLFSLVAEKKQQTAVDLFDAIMTTVVDFVEGGYECFVQGSLRPMLYSDMSLAKMEERIVRCHRLYPFALTGSLGEAEEGMTIQTYGKMMDDLIRDVAELKRTIRCPTTARMISIHLERLRDEKTHFDQVKFNGGLREQPWAGLLFGRSGVGKSSLVLICTVMSLLQNDFPATDEYICYSKETDKYDSTLRSHHTAIIFDDLLNTKLDFMEKSPLADLIDVINNVRAYGNMAEVELKGKVLKEPKVTMTTTNVKDLKAAALSNEPLSVARRHNFTVTVKIKPQFRDKRGMLDASKVAEYYRDHVEPTAEGPRKGVPIIPDIWLLTVEDAIPIPNPAGEDFPPYVGYEVVEWEGRELIEVDIHTFLKWNKRKSQVHFEHQTRLVKNMTNIAKKVVVCKDCGLLSHTCDCHPPPMEEISVIDEEVSTLDGASNQFGGIIVSAVSAIFERKKKRWFKFLDNFGDVFETKFVDIMLNRLETLEKHPLFMWTSYIPHEWLKDDDIKKAILWTHVGELRQRIIREYLKSITGIIIGLFVMTQLGPEGLLFGFVILLRALYLFVHIVETEKLRIMARVSAANQSVPAVLKKVRENSVSWITRGSITLAVLYSGFVLYRSSREKIRTAGVAEPKQTTSVLNSNSASTTPETITQRIMTQRIAPTVASPAVQGNLMPTTLQEIEEREGEAEIVEAIAQEQNWSTKFIAPTPCSEESRTITHRQLTEKIWKNLVSWEYKGLDGNWVLGCNMCFIESNVALIPRHMWGSRTELVIRIARGTKAIQTFESILYKDHSCDVPETDFSLVYIPNAGSWADLSKYLPLVQMESGRSIPVRFTYKKMVFCSTPVRIECDTMLNTQYIEFPGQAYQGGTYHLAYDTGPGLCMAALVSRTTETQLVGFHTAGQDGNPLGIMCGITKSAYHTARQTLSQIPGVLIACSEGTLKKDAYGKQILVSTQIHEKSPLNKLPGTAHLEVYGTCTGRAKYHSKVTETPIAQTVCEQCNVEIEHGKPAFHLGLAWHETLKYSSDPTKGVQAAYLTRGVQEYVETMIGCLQRIPEVVEQVAPLTEMQTVCGIDGRRFIDKLNPQTSIGYPLSGPKSKYITLLEPDDELYPNFACPAELDPQFWQDAYEMELKYLQGVRANPVLKACLKDEPTSKEKTKVRVFQAAPTAQQLLVRKYFLPVARILSLFPIDSECAVGVNTMGPEYDQLIRYMKKHGDDRILALDHSKYDIRMAAQLTLAAFDVLLQLAAFCGYSERDLTIMRGVASDICYPVIAYNGDLIQLFGSNPSGQNMTVYINSIANSLLLRASYYHIFKDMVVPPFKEVVAIMTYGDDVKGSVKEGYDEYNFLTIQEYLASRGMVITPPDKTSDPVPFMRDEDADFLKRSTVYHPELGLYLGALEEKSIFKSLTTVIASNAISLEEQCVQNIDGALREFAFHGREKYELRRQQLARVAELHGMAASCPMLQKSFNTFLLEYCERYGLDPPDLKDIPPSEPDPT